MKALLFVGIGTLLGFVAAVRAARTDAGRTVAARVGARARAFASAVADGYRTRDAELRTTD